MSPTNIDIMLSASLSLEESLFFAQVKCHSDRWKFCYLLSDVIAIPPKHKNIYDIFSFCADTTDNTTIKTQE